MTSKKDAAKDQPTPPETPGPAPTLTQGVDDLNAAAAEVVTESKPKKGDN